MTDINNAKQIDALWTRLNIYHKIIKDLEARIINLEGNNPNDLSNFKQHDKDEVVPGVYL